jgi:hypothetical protein
MSQDLEKNSRQTFSSPNSFLAILEVWLAAHRCPTPGDRRQQFKGSRYSSNTADSGDQQTAGTEHINNERNAFEFAINPPRGC